MKFTNSGNLLSTRLEGEKYRMVLLKEYNENGRCIADFHGVKSITPSFADELFAKLTNELGSEKFMQYVSITNANEEVRSTIVFAINNRTKMDARDKLKATQDKMS